MYVSKGTPPAVLAKINKALNAALNDPEVKTRLAESNIEIVPPSKATPAGLKNHLESEINKWGPVIRKAGAYAD
jgi:tripartite-type tricarboxylate transporter receptor subunit TctC